MASVLQIQAETTGTIYLDYKETWLRRKPETLLTYKAAYKAARLFFKQYATIAQPNEGCCSKEPEKTSLSPLKLHLVFCPKPVCSSLLIDHTWRQMNAQRMPLSAVGLLGGFLPSRPMISLTEGTPGEFSQISHLICK